MKLSRPHWSRSSSSNCSQISQMMVGGRTPCTDSGRSSFFSQRCPTSSTSTRISSTCTSGAGRLTLSSSSSSSSAATGATAHAAAATNDVSSASLSHYVYERCNSATSVLLCAIIIVCPIHVHGVGRTKFSIDVHLYVPTCTCVRECVHALDRIEVSAPRIQAGWPRRKL